MDKVTKLMVYNFSMTNMDWMGYEVKKDSLFTFHHIVKKSNGGKRVYENGAILSLKTAHPYLHIIENIDLEIYLYLNEILKEINIQGYMPNNYQLYHINRALNIFEKKNKSLKTTMGKLLIKEEYTHRINNI